MERKPEWLRIKFRSSNEALQTENLVKKYNLHTVCTSAACPNKGECFSNYTATFMLLGDICTRSCRFCNVNKETPKIDPPNPEEPLLIAKAVKEMGLDYVVLTMVTRDDLPDGGAEHIYQTINEIRRMNGKDIGIEILISDLKGDLDALKRVIEATPKVLNHNIETIPQLYSQLRPQANYSRSLKVLEFAKKEGIEHTKSGFMVGLGETESDVSGLMDDLRSVGVSILTIGQYLAPSKMHYPVKEYVHPDVFLRYKDLAMRKGFKTCFSGPFVRSSYKAKEAFNN